MHASGQRNAAVHEQAVGHLANESYSFTVVRLTLVIFKLVHCTFSTAVYEMLTLWRRNFLLNFSTHCV
jgi:hypothetical protein